jgi:transposase-like protein
MSVLTAKQQYWSEQIENAQRSGQSRSKYAKENDIPAQILYQWRNTLKNITTQVTKETRFTRVVATSEVKTCGLTVRIGEARLQFSCLPDPGWSSELLKNCSVSS